MKRNCDVGTVPLHYGDRWKYGGECDIGIRVYSKWFDPEERRKLAKELKAERIKKLNASIETIKNDIVFKQNKMKEYEDTVAKLESEEDFADSQDKEKATQEGDGK